MNAEITTADDGSVQLYIEPRSVSERALLALVGAKLNLVSDPREGRWYLVLPAPAPAPQATAVKVTTRSDGAIVMPLNLEWIER